jgi:hypothetical protein
MPDPDPASPQSSLPVRGSDQPGWHPYGPAGEVASWDGEAWTGAIRGDDLVPELPHQRRFLPFLRHLWFWLALAGVVVVFAADSIADSTGASDIGWTSVLGYALAMTAAVLIFTRHWNVQLRQLSESVMLWGLASGVVALGLAFGAEIALAKAVAPHPWLNGLTTGLIEEIAKLAVPVALLAFGRGRFSAPRIGVVLAAISGAVFGFAEGVIYQFAQGELVLYSERIFVEFLHPFLSVLAASVIWLAASRRGKTFTVAGLLGMLAAAAIHGLHDAALFAIHPGGKTTSVSAIEVAVTASAIYLLFIAGLFLIVRVAARELVPPSRVPSSSPGWRPRIHQWGVSKDLRAQTVNSRTP